jgi:hypothetical protein
VPARKGDSFDIDFGPRGSIAFNFG